MRNDKKSNHLIRFLIFYILILLLYLYYNIHQDNIKNNDNNKNYEWVVSDIKNESNGSFKISVKNMGIKNLDAFFYTNNKDYYTIGEIIKVK